MAQAALQRIFLVFLYRDSNAFYLPGSKTPTEGNRINAFEDIYTGSTGRLRGKGGRGCMGWEEWKERQAQHESWEAK